jgi:outer membrane lipoprotein-sorting protein
MIRRPIALAAMLLALTGSLAAPAQCASADDLLARMAALNPTLHAFTATMHADVAMKSFPFLSFALVGTYYHQEPDKNKVVFTGGVPAVAQQFDKLYAQIESPSQWRSLYKVTVVSDDGSTTVFKLEPRKHGNVDHIDATVDDRTATVRSMRWNYQNGGFAEMTNRYGRVDGNVLVESQTGVVQEPGYSAQITSTIDGYKINPVLPDGVFSDR